MGWDKEKEEREIGNKKQEAGAVLKVEDDRAATRNRTDYDTTVCRTRVSTTTNSGYERCYRSEGS